MITPAQKALSRLVALDTKAPDIVAQAEAVLEEALEEACRVGVESGFDAGYREGYRADRHDKEGC